MGFAYRDLADTTAYRQLYGWLLQNPAGDMSLFFRNPRVKVTESRNVSTLPVSRALKGGNKGAKQAAGSRRLHDQGQPRGCLAARVRILLVDMLGLGE